MGAGDLVFDVGANIGDYTDTFLSLGARVVAVEPNPDCANGIKRMQAWQPHLNVENVAIGDREGFAELNICDRNTTISTLSEDWRREAVRCGRMGEEHWDRSLQVSVTTLDSLASRHGTPRFVKIDTEGFDDKVLEGMSFRPPCLSFEFILDFSNVARHSLEILGDDYIYNYTVGPERFEFESPAWLLADQMAKRLENISCPDGFGDIFAKHA